MDDINILRERCDQYELRIALSHLYIHGLENRDEQFSTSDGAYSISVRDCDRMAQALRDCDDKDPATIKTMDEFAPFYFKIIAGLIFPHITDAKLRTFLTLRYGLSSDAEVL